MAAFDWPLSRDEKKLNVLLLYERELKVCNDLLEDLSSSAGRAPSSLAASKPLTPLKPAHPAGSLPRAALETVDWPLSERERKARSAHLQQCERKAADQVIATLQSTCSTLNRERDALLGELTTCQRVLANAEAQLAARQESLPGSPCRADRSVIAGIPTPLRRRCAADRPPAAGTLEQALFPESTQQDAAFSAPVLAPAAAALADRLASADRLRECFARWRLACAQSAEHDLRHRLVLALRREACALRQKGQERCRRRKARTLRPHYAGSLGALLAAQPSMRRLPPSPAATTLSSAASASSSRVRNQAACPTSDASATEQKRHWRDGFCCGYAQ
eukprot:TRINITY_DN9554_c0_g2_i1.p1 TRINITY_DN9554_c0_g2~~TRINITY_DN9554_c0_g2_i1.p1  ORF type:complete len:335 (-),score=60.88 TRINITY_DN9554_c0_g2_i1:60-1064(-)